jgi:hypothetical protein
VFKKSKKHIIKKSKYNMRGGLYTGRGFRPGKTKINKKWEDRV